MGVNITYMGTKRALASAVGEVIQRAQPGTLLDAFSGMCAVGEAVGDSRQIWNNDIQIFASSVARAVFVSRDPPLSPLDCGDLHFPRFKLQRDLLLRCFSKSIDAEADMIAATSYAAFEKKLAKLARTLPKEITEFRLRSPHLFAKTYAGNYFGVRQAIEVDAIVAALCDAKSKKRITADEFRWGTIALGRALLKVANSTGHFAQYLKPKPDNFRRYLSLRQRSLWAEWLSSLASLSPVGTAEWRKGNKAFNQDSLSLIPRLKRGGADVSVIYADPPYTDDQYSRYYHIFETLCLYDYPQVFGAGLYRADRFQTPFSVKSKASKALEQFIKRCAATGADLVLSYPTNGLVTESGIEVRSVLRRHFKRVEICHSMAHKHSTFGASKGPAKAAATELIYLARSA
jgi:adenine-specific DNA-methyltransferase